MRFASNIDGHSLAGALAGLDPHDTLLVMASKSFTTAETLKNGERARQWLQAAGIKDTGRHIAAITSYPERAEQWGVPKISHLHPVGVGWGPLFFMVIGVANHGLAVSVDVVAGMQAGAAAMDAHFATASCEQNAPIIMAMTGIVNRSILGYGSLNIAPYDALLNNLVPYLQQLEMESLGKSVDLSGRRVAVPTGPVVWGMPGTARGSAKGQKLRHGPARVPGRRPARRRSPLACQTPRPLGRPPCWRCMHTKYSCRASSEASTLSTSGASNTAKCSPAESFPSCQGQEEASEAHGVSTAHWVWAVFWARVMACAPAGSDRTGLWAAWQVAR